LHNGIARIESVTTSVYGGVVVNVLEGCLGSWLERYLARCLAMVLSNGPRNGLRKVPYMYWRCDTHLQLQKTCLVLDLSIGFIVEDGVAMLFLFAVNGMNKTGRDCG
jgi:hypothetical protein